jgi:hypothetical protein
MEEPSQKRSQSVIVLLWRSPLVWLGLVLATPSFLLVTMWAMQAKGPVPADLFMQSVVKRDGNLGWHQLCPALQTQEPLAALVSKVEQQRRAESTTSTLTFSM